MQHAFGCTYTRVHTHEVQFKYLHVHHPLRKIASPCRYQTRYHILSDIPLHCLNGLSIFIPLFYSLHLKYLSHHFKPHFKLANVFIFKAQFIKFILWRAFSFPIHANRINPLYMMTYVIGQRGRGVPLTISSVITWLLFIFVSVTSTIIWL